MKILWRVAYQTVFHTSLWLWRLFVVALIVLAALVSVGREMAPLLKENKIWLESRLTLLTGHLVQMESVDAHWEGLAPEIHAQGITVGSAAKIDSAHVRVDLLESFWGRSLVFDALDIRSARLTASVDERDTESPLDLRAIREFLFGSDHIRLRDVSVKLLHDRGDELIIRVDSLEAINQREAHWVESSVTLENADTPLHFSAHFQGAASDPLAGEGGAYLSLGEGAQVERAMAFVLQTLDISGVVMDRSARVQGQLWIDWKDDQLDWTADAELHNLKIPALEQRLGYQGQMSGSFERESAGLAALGDSPRQVFTATVPAGEISWGQKILKVPDWGLRYESAREDLDGEPALSLQLPVVHLESLKEYRELVTSRQLRKIVASLNPRGVLERVVVTIPVQQRSPFETVLRANLRDVSVSAWRGVPALETVSGYVESSATAGFVEVDSRHGFAMHFPELYGSAMRYQQLRGRVQWRITTDKDVIVGAKHLWFQGEEGEARASFRVDVPSQAHVPAELYLSVGLRDTPVAYRNKYLPNTLPTSLQRWLKTSIRGGTATENGFIYRGPLQASQADEQSILYFAKIRDGHLKFDPEWPALTGLHTILLVDGSDVRAELSRGKLLSLDLAKTSVQVNATQLLTLQGEVKGDGNSFLRLLRETPLRAALANAVEGWRLRGVMSAVYSLGVPLENGVAGEFQEVVLRLRDNSLWMEKIRLPLESVSGEVYYSSTQGLSAMPLQATLWHKPHTLTIAPVMDNDGPPDILVTTSGQVDPQPLAEWSDLPLIRFLRGAIPVQGRLEIPVDTAPSSTDSVPLHMEFFSNLQEVSIELPEPFRKTAEEVIPFSLQLDVLEDRQRYQFQYGALASGRVDIMESSEKAVRGDVWVKRDFRADETPADGLRIHADLERARLDDWLKVVERYSKWSQLPAHTATGAAAQATTAFPVFDVTLGGFQIGDTDFGQTALWISKLEEQAAPAWQVKFDHAAASGEYRVFDDSKRLPLLIMDRLDLDVWHQQHGEPSTSVAVETAEMPDPLGDVIPQDLPALQFHARQVIHEGNDLGDWKFDVRPQDWGAVLENLQVAMPGMTISGAQNNEGAHLEWRRENKRMETRVHCKVRLTGQEGVKSLFGVDRIIEAKDTAFHGQLSWEGSPAHLQFSKLQGEITFRSVKGRFLNSNARTDFMRVINVFNFNTWARRLQLDFSDLYESGVSYDSLNGHAVLNRGVMIVDQPLVMESPSSRFTFQGKIDSIQGTVDADLAVTLPVGDNAAWVTALAGGLPAAVGVWAVSKIFKKQIDNFSTVSYIVSGELDDPQIRFKRLTQNPLTPPEVTPPLVPSAAEPASD